MLGTFVGETMLDFRNAPDDFGRSKQAIAEINKLIDRVIHHWGEGSVRNAKENLKKQCFMLEVIRCIENSRKHYPDGGLPEIEHTEHSGYHNNEGKLVCLLMDERELPLIDIANESVAFLTDFISRQAPVD